MSAEQKPGGGLRLACDGDWCGKKFSPHSAIATASDLRWRATSYGWLTEPERKKQPSIPGIDAAATIVRDLCPDCRRRDP